MNSSVSVLLNSFDFLRILIVWMWTLLDGNKDQLIELILDWITSFHLIVLKFQIFFI